MKKTVIFILVLSVMQFANITIAQEQPKYKDVMPTNVPDYMQGRIAPKVEDIWVVFKTHCDIGYTMSAASVIKKYREEMMDNAIKLIEADRKKPEAERFKWTIAGWPMAGAILGPLQTNERRLKIEQALREGSISVHALPCTMESDAFEPEDYVRSLVFSSKMARNYGQALSISGKMTDVPAHSWFLPTLLSHAGINFLQIGCNYADRPVYLPPLFWWEGPDGSRVLCNYTPHYGSDVIPPAGWPAKNYIAVVMTHDNEGPPSSKEIADVREQAAKIPGARLHLGTLDDFAKAVLAENLDIPVLRGDMADPWIHGVGSMPVESKTARCIRPLEPALEMLNKQMTFWGIPTSSISDKLAVAYENSMLFGEHTWGAVTPGWGFFSEDGINRDTSRYLYGNEFLQARKNGYYKKFEASFDEHRRYIQIADSIVSGELQKHLELLAGSVNKSGDFILVFNALPWCRSGIVRVNGSDIFVENVPACGYKTIENPKNSNRSAVLDGTQLKTKYYTVQFDLKRGGISSLIEKSSGKELIRQGEPFIFGQYLHERFSEEQTWDYYNKYCVMNNAAWATIKPRMPKDAKYSAVSPSDWKIKIKHNSIEDVVTLTAGNTENIADSISLLFSFPFYEPYVDVDWNIVNKKPDPIPEGGWLCFPFNVENPQFIVGRLGGAIDLAKDQFVGGNRHLYGVNSGAAIVSQDKSGMGLCAIDAPCISFGEPGLWKYSFDYVPKNPSMFVNLYNNMWNTNFPLWIEGSWNSRVRVWPVSATESTSQSIAVNSREVRTPLLAIQAYGKGGVAPSEQSGISLSRNGVLVTAFGVDPDNNEGTLLRVWEDAGISGKLIITLPKNMHVTTAAMVNLRGEKTGGAITISSNQFEFDLNAYAPASFILK